MKDPSVIEERMNRWLEKYGVENIAQLESVKTKKKNTLLKKHGVDHNSKIPEQKEKRREKLQELKNREIVIKLKSTGAKLGSGWWMKADDDLHQIYEKLIVE